MSKNYEPDEKFVEKLEWQLASEYRRAGRLKSASPKIGIPRWAVAVSLTAGVLLTGVAVIKAAEVIRESWRKKIEVARVETEVEIKKAHLESTREMTALVQKQASLGLVEEEESRAVKLAAAKAELDLKRSMLNLDEVKATGDVPRDELYAPLVHGRDFVSERLKIDSEGFTLDLEMIERRLERVEQLVKAKMVQEEERSYLQMNASDIQTALAKITEKLDLRKRFLAADITAREVEIEGRLGEAEKKVQQARARVEALEGQMERLKTLANQGMINALEVRQMEYALIAARSELKLANLEIEVLNRVK